MVRNVALVFCLMTAGMLASGQLYMSIPIADAVAAHFHVPTADVALMSPAFGLAYAVGFLFWGPMSDRLGRKSVLLTGLFATALATLCVAYASDFSIELAARVAQGLCAASIPPAGIALVSETLSPRWRPFGQGMMSFAFIASAPVSQLYAQRAGLGFSSLIMSTVIGFAACGVILAIINSKHSEEGSHQAHPLSHSIKDLFANPVVLTLWGASCTVLFGFVAFQTQLNGALGSAEWDPLTIRALTLLGMLASFGAGFIIRLYGDVRTLQAGLLIAGGALVSTTFGAPLAVTIITLSVGVALSITSIVSAISRSASQGSRGLAIAVYSFCLFVGASLAPLYSHLVAVSAKNALLLPAGLMVAAATCLGMRWMRAQLDLRPQGRPA
ncbi:MFS transporter [Sphingomonas sp. LB2R24]|uniref:MFS transporter n=1 Tax=Sphingomonas sorbitolis TaxID=3096165 RepID=UPI002FCBF54A